MGCAPSSTVEHLQHQLNQYETRLTQLEQELQQQKLLIQRQANEATVGTNTITPQGGSSRMGSNLGLGSAVAVSEIHPAVPAIADSPRSPIAFLPLPSPAHQPSAEEKKARKIDFDVFLSHKRSDTADFARTLKTELTDLGGLTCFLDQDADFELGDLMTKVRGSSTLLFILSEHILESEWCQLELREAILWGLNIVLITAHGARWKLNGDVHDFPPAQLIRPELQSAFENKAIEYNRNFHKASIDQLMQRMFGRPVQASMGEWQIPKVSGETPSLFELDLSTIDGLSLPPSNQLQVIHSLMGWHCLSREMLVCGLSKPFHITQPENDASKYLVKAEAATPYPQEPTRDIPPHEWSFLVLDGLKHAVQTGTCVIQTQETSGFDMKYSAAGGTEREYSVEFGTAFPTRPEIFLSMTRFSGHSSDPVRQFYLKPHHIDSKRFDICLSSAAPPSVTSKDVQYVMDDFSVDWLAFEPRLNRGWTHGEILFINPNNQRKEITKTIHFQSDSTSSSGGLFVSRADFTEPPNVFVGVSGLSANVFGYDLSLRVSDITTTGCQVHCLVWHEDVSQVQSFGKQGFAQVKSPTPTHLSIQWLAIPQTAQGQAVTGAPHHSPATATSAAVSSPSSSST